MISRAHGSSSLSASGRHVKIRARLGVSLTPVASYGPLMPGALSGFLLIGPILCTGLYELSRRIAAGERPRLGHVIEAWRRGTRPLVALGMLLFIASTAWVLASALLFKLFVAVPLDSPLRFLRYAVAGQGGCFGVGDRSPRTDQLLVFGPREMIMVYMELEVFMTFIVELEKSI